MKVVVANVAFSNNNYLVEKLFSEFPNSVINTKGSRIDDLDLTNYFIDADAIVVGLENIDDKLLEKLPNLKMIAKFGVGLNNIDINACKRRNIEIGWTGGVNKRSVAEMTLGFMLSLSRNLFVTSNQLKNGIWNKNGGFQLTGKSIGIIGFGNIGKEVFELLKPFNCNILVNDTKDLNEEIQQYGIEPVSKEFLFKESDIITIHTPLTEETENLINLKVFSMMKLNSILINTARGGIVNETDLKIALQQKLIAGAALDVYSNEPPGVNDLLLCPNLICTPHSGGNSYEAVVAMGLSTLEHLIKFNSKFKR
jgi:phosphoglycerate dehydrogenase-like enzyme